MTQGTMRPAPLAHARKLLRQLAFKLAFILGLAVGLLAAPASAHAEDCWQLSPDGSGLLQGWLAEQPKRCYGAAAEVVNVVLAHAQEALGQPSYFNGHVYWSDNFRAVNTSNGLDCPQTGNQEGASESCWLKYTTHHQYPNETSDEGPSGSGYFAYYLLKCPDGTTVDLSTNRCISTPRISLTGPSSTKALPAGPALPQKALVIQGSAPAANKAVTISLQGGGTLEGTTDASGIFAFTYTPPLRSKVTVQLTGTCSGCANTAQKQITVDGAEVMCSRDPGSLLGNPLSPSGGQKVQHEPDWQDGAAHALSVTRHYRSDGLAGTEGVTGWGAYWSHDYAAALGGQDNQRLLRLGDGSQINFYRDSATSAWVADNRLDGLSETAAGTIYTRARDESRWQFDATGRLTSITQRNGWAMSLAYNAANQLTGVTNAFGRSLQLAYNANGQLTGITTPDGKTFQYSFGDAGRLASVRYPDGTSRTYAYEDSRWPNALTGITDETGVRFASFAYDEAGRAVSTSHAGGVQSYSVAYPAAANATGSLSAGSTVDPAIYRTSVQATDPLGNAQTYTYQGGDGTVRLLGAGGAYEGGQIASRGFVGSTTLPESETDFLGITTLFTWDGARQLKTATTKAASRPESQTSSTQWHTSFRLPILITEQGRTTAYTYDGLGNKLSETTTDTATGQARTWAWTYNGQGLNDTMTDAKGAVWTYGYDAQGNRTSVKNPLNQETRYSYDGAGRVLTQTEPNGLVTSYSYDARGRLISQNRGGETTIYGYTAAGQIASATLPNGYQVSYSYDAAQRLIAANDNRGSSIQYTLDAMGNRVREEVKDQNGNIALATGRVINSLNKVAAIQGAVGQTTALGYDANGEAISQTDPLNQTTRQALDALRRPTATTFADNASASQAWNQLDQLTQVTDPKGVATSYSYNAFGEVMSETSPDIGTLSYTRDAAGNMIRQTDAKGNVTSITRDALDRPTTIQYVPDHIASFTYDAMGSTTRIDDRSGSTVYERDTQGRILSKTQAVNDNPSNPSLFKVSYGYANGDLTSITYPSGLKVFYNRTAGRITGIDVQEPGGTVKKPKPVTPWVTGLNYTALGQPKAWSWSNGDVANRTFDADGRMVNNEFASYSYDAASRITGITQNLWASRTVTSVVGTNTTTVTELYQTPLNWTAGYDSRNRLISFVRDGADTRYTYDANSNRLTAIDKATSDTDLDGIFEQDDFTQITNQALNVDGTSNKLLGFTQTVTTTNKGKTKSVVTTPVSYAVDANGAMTSDGLRTFDYDASNRMAKVTILKDGEAASISYLHNAMGQRVFKGEPTAAQMLPNQADLGASFVDWLKKNFSWLYATAQANTSIGTAFVYGDSEIPNWALLGDYDNGSAKGAGRTEYVWLPTEDGGAIPVGMYRGSKFFAIHSDHLGTPRLMTNEVNTPVWQWPYSAFGNNKPAGVLKATPNPKAAITNKPVLLKATAATALDLRFPGQIADEETGLNQNFFRMYDGKTGRYTQFDPIGLAGGWNGYAYVGGNPLSYTDPLGLNPLAAAAGFCFTNPLGFLVCAGGAAAMSMPPVQQAAKNLFDKVVQACTPKLDENKCNATMSRAAAQAAAHAWAGISPTGQGANPLPWSNLNLPSGMSRGDRAYGDFMRQYFPANYGYGTPAGASVVEHPFGHPDQPGPAHHACPHFHATNAAGQSQIFTYKPS